MTWGEYFDARELERKLTNACEIIASLELKVNALELRIEEMNLIHSAPIGTYVPRNRKFN